MAGSLLRRAVTDPSAGQLLGCSLAAAPAGVILSGAFFMVLEERSFPAWIWDLHGSFAIFWILTCGSAALLSIVSLVRATDGPSPGRHGLSRADFDALVAAHPRPASAGPPPDLAGASSRAVVDPLRPRGAGA